MSRIDELIEELSPGGFPRRPLSELCKFTRGSNLEKKELLSEGFPAVHYGEIHTHYGYKTERTKSFVSQIKASKMRKAMPGDLVLVTTSESADEVAKPLAWLGDLPLSVGGECYIVQSQMDSIFLAHLFQSADFKREIQKFISGTKVKRISANDLGKIAIPAPPLVVQREIVSILDKFTHLEAELEAELEARRIQYQVTRDRLLDFDGDLSSHPLGEMIGEVCPTGVSMKIISEVIGKVGSIKWGEAGGQEYRYLDLSSVDLLTHEIGETTKISSANAPSRARQIVQKGDVIFATTRPAQMRFARIPETYDGQIASTGYCVLRPEPTDVLSGFLEHSLGSRAFRAYVVNNQVEGNYPSISDRAIKDFAFHVPPLEIQQEIVSILDKLDALVNDITIGLPAEIAARRKQYEYYRNKLLTFKELEAA